MALAEGDPLFSDVALLLHMDGSNEGTTFTDVTGKTVTAVGEAVTSTAISKFGGASACFLLSDWDYGDYDTRLSISDVTVGHVLGVGTHTYEAWIYLDSSAPYPGGNIFSTFGLSGEFGYRGWTLAVDYTNQGLTVSSSASYTPIIASSTNAGSIQFDQWQHVALVWVRAEIGTLQCFFYVDGQEVASAYVASSLIGFEENAFADIGGGPFPGYIDEFRITKDSARYTGNFTPPTEAFSELPYPTYRYPLNQSWVLDAPLPHFLNQAWLQQGVTTATSYFNQAWTVSVYTTLQGATDSGYAVDRYQDINAPATEWFALNAYRDVNAGDFSYFALSAYQNVSAPATEWFALSAYQNIGGGYSSYYGLDSAPTLVGTTDAAYGLEGLKALSATTDTRYALAPFVVLEASADSGYELGAYAELSSVTHTHYALEPIRMAQSVAESSYALRSYSVITGETHAGYAVPLVSSVSGVTHSDYVIGSFGTVQGQTDSVYYLPVTEHLQASTNADYGLRVWESVQASVIEDYALLAGQVLSASIETQYGLPAAQAVQSTLETAYSVQLYVNVSAVQNSDYGLLADFLLSGSADSAYALAPVSQVTGYAESAFSLHVYEAKQGQTYSGYQLATVQSVSAIQESSYSLNTWSVLYGQAQAQYALTSLTLAYGSTEARYGITAGEAFSSWAINLQTGAVSKYEQYNFTSFAFDGTRHLATSEDGIYVLDGDDDNGTDIAALVDIGPQTFGSPYLKRMTTAYLGLSNDGDMQWVQETDDGVTSTQTLDYSGTLQLRKLLLPKGQTGNYHRFTLKNKNGADFTLDSVELMPDILSRRRTGAHQ